MNKFEKFEENQDNYHKEDLSKFYSKINLYCKLLNFIDMEWSLKANCLVTELVVKH